MARSVVIIGAGVGGLVAALALVVRGFEVTLLERADRSGGKMRRADLAGMSFDAGPTVLTMPHVFEDIFSEAGEDLGAHIVLRPAEILARHAWEDGSALDLLADRDRSADAIADFAGAAEAEGYRRFCRRASEIHDTLQHTFITATRPNPLSLAARCGVSRLGSLMRISPFSTMWDELGHYFADPRLRQLFGRYATYCGSSPFAAPATLMLVAHVEQEGVWLVDGGMHRLAEAIARLIEKHGGRIIHGADVSRIRIAGGKATGVETVAGQCFSADAVVMNGDCEALAAGCLGEEARRATAPLARSARSLSVVTHLLSARVDGFPLSHHNVFFSRDSRAEFDDIFQRGRLPQAPTVYVCAQDRDAAAQPPSDARRSERLFCLVNAPALGDERQYSNTELQSCEDATFGLLTRCGLTIDRIQTLSRRTTPQDFAEAYPATGGSLYGRASHGWMASFTRPGSRSRIAGLYLAGGSTHPGPGVPMAALSGRQAAQSIMTDLAPKGLVSTARFRPAAMHGGISTR